MSRPGSPVTSRSTTSSALSPCRSSSTPSMPRYGFAHDWVATAPAAGAPKQQIAPTAGTAVDTATPVMPVRGQRAAMENVTGLGLSCRPRGARRRECCSEGWGRHGTDQHGRLRGGVAVPMRQRGVVRQRVTLAQLVTGSVDLDVQLSLYDRYAFLAGMDEG